jgi:hypothetical protein
VPERIESGDYNAPESIWATGNRTFCVGSTGIIRTTFDGKAPAIVDGVCDPAARLVY